MLPSLNLNVVLKMLYSLKQNCIYFESLLGRASRVIWTYSYKAKSITYLDSNNNQGQLIHMDNLPTQFNKISCMLVYNHYYKIIEFLKIVF